MSTLDPNKQQALLHSYSSGPEHTAGAVPIACVLSAGTLFRHVFDQSSPLVAGVAWTTAQENILALRSVKMERPTVNNCLTNAQVPQANPGSSNFTFETDPYNTRVPYVPAAVALPTTVQHVIAAVKCAISSSVRVSAKSGGHSYASFGLGGENGHLIIDFKYMHNVTVNPTTQIATLQPGCRLGNVAQALYAQGKRAMSHGTCPP